MVSRVNVVLFAARAEEFSRVKERRRTSLLLLLLFFFCCLFLGQQQQRLVSWRNIYLKGLTLT